MPYVADVKQPEDLDQISQMLVVSLTEDRNVVQRKLLAKVVFDCRRRIKHIFEEALNDKKLKIHALSQKTRL